MLGLLACGPAVDPTAVDATSPPPGTSGSSGSPSDATGPSSATTNAMTTGDADDGTGSPFLVSPDGGGSSIECDLWSQDCPPGEKCMPWANDGGNTWNATRCTPIDDDPRSVGEPCTVVESGVSGIDDCVRGAMCWDVDPETNMGHCIGMCQGSEANPFCEDPCDQCMIGGEGVIAPCLPPCDPIGQDCDAGEACYPIADAFVCGPDVSGELGVVGDPCEFINVCDAGNFCANAESVPGCDGATGCCAPFCDAAAADPCDTLLPGTSCVPWFEQGQGPKGCVGQGIPGACLLPS